MNIFVGNLSNRTTAQHLSELFLQFGQVISSKIVIDIITGHSRGFGFIEMDNRSGIVAIQKLNNMSFMNCHMKVNEASL